VVQSRNNNNNVILHSFATWRIHLQCTDCVYLLIVLLQQLGTQSETEKRLQTLAAMKQTDAASHEQLSRLEEDIRQQDVILGGYEKDNEQLRSEMKQLRATNKANEERMFHENRKLKTEIANLRSVLVSLTPHPSVCTSASVYVSK